MQPTAKILHNPLCSTVTHLFQGCQNGWYCRRINTCATHPCTRSHVYLQWYVHQSMLASGSVSVGQSQRVTHHLTLTLQFLPLRAAHRHNKLHIIFVSQLQFVDRQQNFFRITLDFFFQRNIRNGIFRSGWKKHHRFAKKSETFILT